MPARYFLDWEFIEDGHTIDPISVGIVDDAGLEYYAVFEDAPWERIRENEWLTANVVPQLPFPDGWKPREQIRSDVKYFLSPFVDGEFRGNIELWTWFGAYDHLCLAQLFGSMADYPIHLPKWSNDARQWHYQLGEPDLPEQQSGLHDALEDARHLRRIHAHLTKVAAQWSPAI